MQSAGKIGNHARQVAAAAVAALALGASACNDTAAPVRLTGVWQDYGRLPAVDAAWSIAAQGNRVLVGTSEGVFARTLGTFDPWQRVGLEGLDVHAVRFTTRPSPTFYAVGYPTQAGVQPVYRSTDGGVTWTAGGGGLVSDATGDPLGVHDIAIQPPETGGETPVLYAVASGTNIARSLDQGATWTIVHGMREEMATYDCYLHVLDDWLYQGCEAPLDHAWVRRFNVSDRTAPSIGEGELVIDGIENRRINGFASFPGHATVGHLLYVGVEGGVIAYEPGGDWEWVHQFTQESPRYTYVRSIWVDPNDERHIIFGGGEEELVSDRSGFWETRDGGVTVRAVDNPLDIDFARASVPALVQDGPRSLILLVHDGSRQRRVMRWHLP